MTAREMPIEDGVVGGPAPAVLNSDPVVVHLPGRRTALPLLDGTTGLLAASQLALTAKRGLDVFGSLVLLTILAPVLLVLAMVVKVSSPGPVMYWSTRVGKDGSRFPVPKFRSMYLDAEQRLRDLLPENEVTGPVFKMKNDPRVTRVGRLLRRSSLDELPQLFSVLAGHMSLVGPRPPLESEVATYTPLEMQRLSVKPGITCVWQVSGRSDLDFETWMEMDLDYIRNWTPGTDIWILLRTVPAVVSGRGAY